MNQSMLRASVMRFMHGLCRNRTSPGTTLYGPELSADYDGFIARSVLIRTQKLMRVNLSDSRKKASQTEHEHVLSAWMKQIKIGALQHPKNKMPGQTAGHHA